jgi:hypothetical protein
MDDNVPGRGDREVSLSPAVDFIELGGVGNRKDLTGLPVALTAGGRRTHALMIKASIGAEKGKRSPSTSGIALFARGHFVQLAPVARRSTQMRQKKMGRAV